MCTTSSCHIINSQQRARPREAEKNVLKLSQEQLDHLGGQSYAERMRRYLNEQFPESNEVPSQELETTILELTERASGYKLILETDVAAFITSAWLLGLDFDQQIPVIKETLEDRDKLSIEKSEFLWQFMEDAFSILEGGDHAGQ